MAYKALDIANELLRLAEREDEGDLMSNLKLQKMLYYQQGFHLAYFGTPLFDEEIEAWMYGPVVPEVYDAYDHYGRNGIESDPDKEMDFEPEEWRLFLKVFDIYGQYSAIGLMNMTHQEPTWMNVRKGHGCVISKESMTEFFKTRIKA
ncbi:MAG: DUF4065 domain-containing protein [Pseudoflavonifractor sp.]|nr:DUF4065 domain-containing protein [Pseudoflavonifractor sp.]